jgi:Cu(I)/Ag(I) efflux system membrane fusion protein
MNHSLTRQAFAFHAIIIMVLHSCTPQNRDESAATQAAVTISIPDLQDVDPVVKTQLADFLAGYFAVNQALIEDSLAGAKEAALELTAATGNFEMSKLSPEQMDFYLVQSSMLKNGLKEISASNNIEQARAGLATVSEAMYSLVKAFHSNESTLYYQYCPMARDNQGANWLSATEELVNPYMGQMMLRCGRTQEKLEP